jgi:hypothetical protein
MALTEEQKEARRLRKEALKKAKEAQKENDLEILDGLEQQYGDDEVRPVWSEGGLVVIGRPKPAQINRWQEMVSRDGKPDARATRRRTAAATLAKQCLIYPDKGEYDELVERWPGIPSLVAAECLDFAQLSYEEEAEK